MASSSEIQTQDLLDDFTSGLQSGDDTGELMRRTESSAPEVSELVGTINALHAALSPVEPRPEFVESLRADLVDSGPGALGRVRQMPARISIAAALALVAGCLLFFLRRLFDSDGPQEIKEEAIAAPL